MIYPPRACCSCSCAFSNRASAVIMVGSKPGWICKGLCGVQRSVHHTRGMENLMGEKDENGDFSEIVIDNPYGRA